MNWYMYKVANLTMPLDDTIDVTKNISPNMRHLRRKIPPDYKLELESDGTWSILDPEGRLIVSHEPLLHAVRSALWRINQGVDDA
jgi:hypothetical protein